MCNESEAEDDDDIPLSLVGSAGDTLLDLVGCGLALLGRHLLLSLCHGCQQMSMGEGWVEEQRTVGNTLAVVVSHLAGWWVVGLVDWLWLKV